jgi:hypothetical protein
LKREGETAKKQKAWTDERLLYKSKSDQEATQPATAAMSGNGRILCFSGVALLRPAAATAAGRMYTKAHRQQTRTASPHHTVAAGAQIWKGTALTGVERICNRSGHTCRQLCPDRCHKIPYCTQQQQQHQQQRAASGAACARGLGSDAAEAVYAF